MKLLIPFTISHIPEINITNRYCKHSPLYSVTPQGSHRTPYLILNLGHPCTSVYLLLTVKTTVVCLFSVSPPLSPVEWLAGFVMLLSGIVVLSGFMRCIFRTTRFSHPACPVHSCLWTWMSWCMVQLDVDLSVTLTHLAFSFSFSQGWFPFHVLFLQITDPVVCLPLTSDLSRCLPRMIPSSLSCVRPHPPLVFNSFCAWYEHGRKWFCISDYSTVLF